MIPLVSVCIFTYNHEKYIEQCIESVLMQKTNFNFEIVIGEDYSIDNTRIICKYYEKMNLNKIHVLDRGQNLGMCENVFDTIKKTNGNYIAILDGDDYWIHPLKLQKQFDFLELHKDMNLVFHQTITINELSKRINLFVQNEKNTYKFDDLVDNWLMATGSMFFRKEAMDYPEFVSHSHNFDLAIQMIVNRKGNEIGYLKEIMSVYRINLGSNTNNPAYNSLNTWRRQKLLFEEFDNYSNEFHSMKIQAKLNILSQYIKSCDRFSIRNKFKLLLKYIITRMGYQVMITKIIK